MTILSPIVGAGSCGRRLMMTTLIVCGLSAPAFAAGAFDGPGPLSVPAAAFELDGYAGSDYFFTFSGGYLYQVGAETACFMAPLYLPNGTKIASIEVSAYDENPTLDFSVAMFRASLLAVVGEVMAEAGTSGASGLQLPLDETISFPIIDNSTYSYHLGACLAGGVGASLRLYAVKIEHSTLIFADGFESGDTAAWSTSP